MRARSSAFILSSADLALSSTSSSPSDLTLSATAGRSRGRGRSSDSADWTRCFGLTTQGSFGGRRHGEAIYEGDRGAIDERQDLAYGRAFYGQAGGERWLGATVARRG
ncbi:hypothetical protein PR202_gb11947 [Eleusine coracana subsp. coracana]|uniref:Uncharacterized protein n=1 Tax=Eleusine coracana subsp. coracana TaxID=191504 RepID=A0AAV5ENT0_ELECO|nr:hypothetical protein PR202_gb11947 [Eleusine coracana subsp. coracana]